MNPSQLPPIRVISLTASKPVPQESPRPITDLRWLLIEEFLNSARLSANSRKAYQRELRRFLDWTDLGWGDLKSRHLGQYKHFLMEALSVRHGKPLSPSSINAALTALKSFFSWACRVHPQRVPVNPTVGLRFEKVPLPPAQSLSEAEVAQVWAALEQLQETRSRDKALIHLLSHGLRAGEVVDLNLAAFDGRILFLADTKTDEPRLVPLRRESVAVLEQYLQERREDREGLSGDRPLILSMQGPRKGDRLSYHGIYFVVEKIGAIAGLPDLHPHLFRHTYATELLLMGVDPAHARRLTGHRSEQAFRRYTLRGEQEAAIAAYYRAIGEVQQQEG
ncbi:MAG: tyrosine-type recombinase/integrase [Oculatellaceae cyanobacterium Prado106]|jgi:integrase/recombinase XerD|nr:tyrosine-type recombinase/integrase [Oculatellaceae cyanobacterium Prado106]